MSELLTMQEAADTLRMSRRTLERHIKAGAINMRKIGRKCLIEQIEIKKFIKRN